jgi:hypothetical protein
VLDRIVEQVDKHAFEQAAVGEHGRQVLGDVDDHDVPRETTTEIVVTPPLTSPNRR